jgi:hypothetical protein
MPTTIRPGNITYRTYTIQCGNCDGVYRFKHEEQLETGSTNQHRFRCPCCEAILTAYIADRGDPLLLNEGN